MSIVIFTGPSLKASDRALYPGFEFRPPAQQGDLYLAAQNQPKAIGLIDGFFDGAPAVLHKEILWAISQGIAVFGAASMGALRATELAPFGMIGVGQIFADFHAGRLQDDDEVALAHGPAETGYLALSEPMVNIRATLAQAVATGTITQTEADLLQAQAKSCFYQDRNWTTILAEGQGVTRARLAQLRIWLSANRIDQKRLDATLLLHEISAYLATGHLTAGHRPKPAGFTFETTEAFAHAPWQKRRAARADSAAILDELRLEGAGYPTLRDHALLAYLARQDAAQNGFALEPRQISDAACAFRLPLGLFRQQDADLWAAQNDLDRAGFERLIRIRSDIAALAQRLGPDLEADMLDQLRLQNRYATLRAKAQAKSDLPDGVSLPSPLLIAWFFHQHLQREIPPDVLAFAEGCGFTDLAHFLTAIAAEYAQMSRLEIDAEPRHESVKDEGQPPRNSSP